MGILKKIIKSAVNVVAAPVKSTLKAANSLVKGDFKGVGNNLLGAAKGVGDIYSTAVTGGLLRYKDGKLNTGIVTDAVTGGIGIISGATAMGKAMEQQNRDQLAQAKQQAISSEAVANEAANRDDARIGSGKRKKSNKVSNSAGLGGVSQGTGTGVQS